ncbi:MAG: spermidine synthase [Chloroflexia bacterium]
MVYYALAVLLSAFLLFQVEPLIGKIVLPWFGGASSVWSTILLFFQVLLTAGYGYAYWLVRHPRWRRQGAIHGALLLVSLALLLLLAFRWETPITPPTGLRPADPEHPIGRLFLILLVSVGLPYFLLSTNSPLMQAWFSRDVPGRLPYPLYAVSNAGSLAGLLSYPFLIEPWLTLRVQAWVWSLGYLAFILCIGVIVVRTLRFRAADGPARQEETASLEAPGAAERVLWVALPAVASALLLATTSQITQEVAPVPLLWVLPLGLYLLSFILCFSGKRWYSRRAFALSLGVGSAVLIWTLARPVAFGLVTQVALYCLVLWVACMFCHGELARLQPHPHYLTAYYLLMSVGGALGGMAVSLLAPLLFRGYWELHLGLLACWALLWIVVARDRPSGEGRLRWLFALAGLGTLAAFFGVVLLAHIQASLRIPRYAVRNFYGVLRVVETRPNPSLRAYQLNHGNTVHGFQLQDPAGRDLPTAYFTEESGIGLALRHYPRRDGGIRIGVLGLGIGTLATYAQPGDTVRFYEINPAVVALAQGEGGFFSYLARCRGRVEIVQGDARVSLERELREGQPQQYDILVLDVFSGDSIPVHLLTREAFEVYLQHLRPHGVLALHITNRYLDLRPVVWSLADHFGLKAALIESAGDGERAYRATWMLLTDDAAFLEQPAIASRATPRPDDLRRVRLWTDDYSNLFRILK